LTKGVGFPNELYAGPLGGVWREEDFAQWRSERFNSPREVQALKELESSVVDPHAVLLVEVDEAGVERAVIGGREGDSVLNVVDAAWGSNGEDVCCIELASVGRA